MSEPLVFLPGMMCDARLFTPQIAAFSAHRALMVAPIGGHDTVEELAAKVLADAPARFALLGLSMGGIVAMEIVRQAPDRVTRLALLDTNPNAELPEVAALRAPQIDAVRQGRLTVVMRDEMKPNYLAEGPDKADILDLCMDMAEALGPEVFVKQSLALKNRPDQKATLASVGVPTLVLCGAEDKLCPPERHHLMAGLIRNATLNIIPDAGHMPTLENPTETNKAIAKWLN